MTGNADVAVEVAKLQPSQNPSEKKEDAPVDVPTPVEEVPVEEKPVEPTPVEPTPEPEIVV